MNVSPIPQNGSFLREGVGGGRFGTRLLLPVLILALTTLAFATPSDKGTFYREHCLFIKKGLLKSESATPDAILRAYEREAPGKPLVIHFHGGLVSEESAKHEAISLSNAAYGENAYPVFFVWNADFWTELNNTLESHAQAAGTSLMEWTKADTWIKARERLTKRVTNYFSNPGAGTTQYHDSSSVSWGGDVLEWVAYNLGGRQVWQQMKQDTADSFKLQNGRPGAGLLFLRALKRHPVKRVVLVGHSTGCIYILNFLEAARRIVPNTRFDVVFLAPANTYRDTAAFLNSGPTQVANFRMFGISDGAERRDHMLWQLNPALEGLYPGSLLFFVSRAVESRHNMPILGLQRDYATPPTPGPDRDANLIVKRFLFSRPRSVVWSPTPGPAGLSCSCTDHGTFCEDVSTLQSLRYLVKNESW